jgi:hypothetical protein
VTNAFEPNTRNSSSSVNGLSVNIVLRMIFFEGASPLMGFSPEA